LFPSDPLAGNDFFETFSLEKFNPTTFDFCPTVANLYDVSYLPSGGNFSGLLPFDQDEEDSSQDGSEEVDSDDLEHIAIDHAIVDDHEDSDDDDLIRLNCDLSGESDLGSQNCHGHLVGSTDALIAIREMAFGEKKNAQRKHKNSTSSVSSMSTIKKVAIELQNTANMAHSSAVATSNVPYPVNAFDFSGSDASKCLTFLLFFSLLNTSQKTKSKLSSKQKIFLLKIF
jgi:hypothetical protein